MSRETRRIYVRGFPPNISEDKLQTYFQSRRKSGGGDIENLELESESNVATIIFEDKQAAENVCKKQTHYIDGNEVQVSRQPFKKITHDEAAAASMNEHEATEGNAVLVRGIAEVIGKETLSLYFENKRRSGGGNVDEVIYDKESGEAVVVFQNTNDAENVVKRSHRVGDTCLQVDMHHKEVPNPSCCETQVDEQNNEQLRVIKVEGIGDQISEEYLTHYFENKNRSGGGDVEKVVLRPEKNLALVKYMTAEDAHNAVKKGEHKVNEKYLKVTLRKPIIEPPQDPRRILIENLTEATTDEHLELFLEAGLQSECHLSITRGKMNNALVLFTEDIKQEGFEKLTEKARKKKLCGSRIVLKRVPICSCVLVQGICEGIPEDMVSLYFENEKRSGGGPIKIIEFRTRSEAVVRFEDNKVVERVVSRTQTISGHSVKVHPYYPFLEEVMEDETNSEDEEIDGRITDHDYAEIPCDSDMLDYLKTYHVQKFKKYVKIPHHVDLQFPDHNRSIVVRPTGSEKTDLRAAKTDLKKVIDGIKKTSLDIPGDILHDVQRDSKEMLKEYRPDEAIVTNGERDVTVIGGISAVELILQGFRDIIDRTRTKHDIEKRIKDYEESGIPEKKLKLLEEHGIISEVEKKYNYLKISTTADGGKLIFRGLKEEYSQARVDILGKYIAGITENMVDAGNGVTELMKNDPRAIKSFNDELKNNKMVAMVFVKEKRDSKQLILLSLDDKNEGMADKLLSSYYSEKILPVTETHKHILVSKLWTDFKKQQESSRLINIMEDDHGLTIAGKQPDVEKISRNIEEFLKETLKSSDTRQTSQGFQETRIGTSPQNNSRFKGRRRVKYPLPEGKFGGAMTRDDTKTTGARHSYFRDNHMSGTETKDYRNAVKASLQQNTKSDLTHPSDNAMGTRMLDILQRVKQELAAVGIQ